MSIGSPSVVRHHGVLFPHEGVATLTRDDDLVVVVSFRIDAERGPLVTSYSVTAPERGSRSGPTPPGYPSRRSPTRAARMLAIRKEGAESESVRIGPLRPVRTDTQRLQHLADLYDQAVDAGEPVAEYVGQHLEVSVTQTHR